jgi:aspartate/methionine/tyrosine aminotransferase
VLQVDGAVDVAVEVNTLSKTYSMAGFRVGFALGNERLMEGAEIAVAPGAGFGEYGDGYVRIALVENEQRIRQAARNLKRFLQSNAAPAAAE